METKTTATKNQDVIREAFKPVPGEVKGAIPWGLTPWAAFLLFLSIGITDRVVSPRNVVITGQGWNISTAAFDKTPKIIIDKSSGQPTQSGIDAAFAEMSKRGCVVLRLKETGFIERAIATVSQKFVVSVKVKDDNCINKEPQATSAS